MSVNIKISKHIFVKGSIVSVRKFELNTLFEGCGKCPKETCLRIIKLLEEGGVNCTVSNDQVDALKKALWKISNNAKKQCSKGGRQQSAFLRGWPTSFSIGGCQSM